MQLYIYRQFIRQIPMSLDESARLDGCGYFRTYLQIIFPLLLPATATLAIIKTVDVINDMYIPYLYMPSEKLETLTTMLISYSGALKGAWQTLAACVIIVMIPTLLLYLLFSKFIFAGIVSGAVKE
jgi:multiple sugar transport system permease protein